MKNIKEVKHLEEVFPRLCDFSNTGMCDGWHLQGDYISSSEYLEEYVKETFNQTISEFWREIGCEGYCDEGECTEDCEDCNDEYYYTEWYELEDMEDEAFLFDGTKLTCIDFSELLYEDEQGQKYKVIT